MTLPTSASGQITSFLPFICMRDRPHSTAQHDVAKYNAKSADLFFHSRDDESASTSVPLPSPQLYQSTVFSVRVASACGITGGKKNQRSHLTDVHVDNLMLIATEGPRLEGTETSAVICHTCTEVYSRRDRQKFTQESTGLFFKKLLSMCVASCLIVHISFKTQCLQ